MFVHGERRELAAAAVERAGLLAVGELRSIGVPVAVGTPAQIRAVAAEPGVTFVEHNEALDLLLDTARTATRADAAIAETVGDLGPFTGAGQSIAIVDGGVDGTHPMFADPETGQSKVVRNLRVACLDNLPGLTFRAAFGADPATCPSAYTGYPDEGGTNDPFLVDVTDGNDSDSATLGGHGTHVAGIAAGNAVTTADGRRLSGVAPGAKVVAIAVGASVTIYAANAALDWIARNHTDPCGDGSCPPITVVNNSYGGGGPWDPESATSKISAKLLAEGVTMVWANGNGDLQGDGGDGSVNRSGRDAANPTPGVIAVANYDDGETGTADGTLHPTSSRGDRSDPTTWPDLSAPGTNITSACRVHLTICDGAFSADPNYGTITGTSMAAPHVAGAVAVVQEAARAARGAFLAPAEVEDLLQATAHRFDFGADYVEDPAKPGRLTSFDKGHGLLDLLNAVRAVAGASPAPVSASAACPPDAPLVTDPAEDATAYAVVDTGANEASLDVVAVDVRGEPERERMVLTFQVLDLADSNPDGTTGISFEGTLSVAAADVPVRATRTASGMAFTVGGVPTSGRFDAVADQVRVALPRALLDDVSGPVVVKALTGGYTRRMYAPTPLAPVADSFTGSCARTVDVGGAPAPPDGRAAPGAPFRWTGEPTVSATDPVGLGLGVFAGWSHDTRRVQIDVGPRGTITFALTCDGLDDFDIYLTGPDGAPVGEGTAPGTSAAAGCDEQIVVTGAISGVYTATVHAFLSAGGTVYRATLRTK